MTCIVVDDEPLARKGMQMLIEQMPRLKLKGVFSNALDADDFMKQNEVDVLFLDIQMPMINGMEYIRSTNLNAKVIVTTAYPQFAVEAFEFEVADYLVKPIRFERFYKAINKLQKEGNQKTPHFQKDEDHIFIRTERKYVRTNFNEIDFIEALKDYVIVHCRSEKHIVAANLKTITSCLPPHIFIRVNKSYLINVLKIHSIDNEWVVVNGKQLPIGDSYRRNLFDYIHQKKVMKRT